MAHLIISIGRQFGSGGSNIGKALAKSFGINYYDKELLAEAARESGLSKEVFERVDEQMSHYLAYAYNMGWSYFGGYSPFTDILSNEGLFKLQSDAIRNLAKREPCVIVGRCADYILRDYPGCISIFIHNTMENRIRNVQRDQPSFSEEQIKELIAKTDKSRASYYNFYTNKTWGMASSYNLSVDVSTLGFEPTVKFLRNFIEHKRQPVPPYFG